MSIAALAALGMLGGGYSRNTIRPARRALTDEDRKRIAAAEAKRARKNARRLAEQAKRDGAK